MTKNTMNRSRILTILATALVTALPATAHAGTDIPGRGTLPDDRGYELVSPPDKNGSDVMADSGRTRASVSGDALDFASLGAFGDAQGTGISTEYMSRRTAQAGTRGWSTHAIVPRVDSLNLMAIFRGKDTIYQGEFSDDLSKGVFQSYTPLTDDPNVSRVTNLYLREDALDSGPGTYRLLSACPGCSSPLTDPFGGYLIKVADTTSDLGHVLFEARRNLTSDAPPYPPYPSSLCNNNPLAPFLSCDPRLYEWDHGVLRLAGILPDGTSAPISMAGIGATGGSFTLNTMSADGTKIFFTVPSSSSDIGGDLYVRVNHTNTVKLNASERTDCADQNPCTGVPEPDPAGPRPATYLMASGDGSKVFFRSLEQLTDAPGGTIYVYDTTLPVSDPNHLRHVFVDNHLSDGATEDGGLLGTNDDGSYAYFLDQSALLPGQQDLPPNVQVAIYAWHDGTVSFIGAVDDDDGNNVGKSWPGLASRVTRDGRTLLFRARSGVGLTGYDHGNTCGNRGCAELYRYRADTGSLTCISCNPTGARATANANTGANAGTGGAASSSHLNHPLTPDGDHVFFETGEQLLPQQDVNGKKTDVYEWTAVGADRCTTADAGYRAASDGCLALLTTGVSTENAHFLDASPDGHDVFVSTNQRLTGWDSDNNVDLYDVRIGGGFPEPAPSLRECGGDGCQGPTGTAPAALSQGSTTLDGSSVHDDARGTAPRARISGIRQLSAADKATLARGGRARLRLTVNRSGTLTLVGSAKVSHQTRRILSATVKARHAGPVSIPFSLSRRARAELHRRGSLTIAITVRLDDSPPTSISVTLTAVASSRKAGTR